MTDVISWNKAIDKKVKTSDDKDLGKKIIDKQFKRGRFQHPAYG